MLLMAQPLRPLLQPVALLSPSTPTELAVSQELEPTHLVLATQLDKPLLSPKMVGRVSSQQKSRQFRNRDTYGNTQGSQSGALFYWKPVTD